MKLIKNKIVTMYNPKNGVVIVTNSCFRNRWEQLGFVENPKLILLNFESDSIAC